MDTPIKFGGYREKIINDSRYSDWSETERLKLSQCTCDGCGVMFSSQFHYAGCPEIENIDTD